MNFIYDNINFIDNQEMIAKHQLAFNLKSIIVNYHNNKNLERFYRKINRHSKNISVYISNDSFIDFKSDIKKIYDDMINGEFDQTIINDCIQNIERIILYLLVFI
jgi:deoxyadenosine/deoxycytidine kinase